MKKLNDFKQICDEMINIEILFHYDSIFEILYKYENNYYFYFNWIKFFEYHNIFNYEISILIKSDKEIIKSYLTRKTSHKHLFKNSNEIILVKSGYKNTDNNTWFDEFYQISYDEYVFLYATQKFLDDEIFCIEKYTESKVDEILNRTGNEE